MSFIKDRSVPQPPHTYTSKRQLYTPMSFTLMHQGHIIICGASHELAIGRPIRVESRMIVHKETSDSSNHLMFFKYSHPNRTTMWRHWCRPGYPNSQFGYRGRHHSPPIHREVHHEPTFSSGALAPRTSIGPTGQQGSDKPDSVCKRKSFAHILIGLLLCLPREASLKVRKVAF